MKEIAQVVFIKSFKYKNYLFYCGGHTIRKDVGSLVRAYSNLSPRIKQRMPLLIVGKGRWQKQVSKTDRDKNIFALEKMPNYLFYQAQSGALIGFIVNDGEGHGVRTYIGTTKACGGHRGRSDPASI